MNLKIKILSALLIFCVRLGFCQNINLPSDSIKVKTFFIEDSIRVVEAFSKSHLLYSSGYYRNNSVAFANFFCNQIEVGSWLSFYSNGRLQWIKNYNYFPEYDSLPLKKETDTNFIFYSKTKIYTSFSVIEYRNPRIGKVITYYDNGNIESVSFYKDYNCTKKENHEIKTGVWKFYNKEGTLIYERIYENGKFISDKFYW